MPKTKTIGATIRLGGEKEYRKAISDINDSMKVLRSEMKKSTAEFGSNSKSLKSLSAQKKQLREQIEQQTLKVNTLQGAVEQATKKYGENSKEVKRWKVSLNDAEAELTKMNSKFDELKKQTTGLGKVKTAFSDMKDKMSEIKSKLSPITEGFKKVAAAGAKIAKLSFKAVAVGVAAIGTAAVAAGKKMWSLASEAAKAGDQIDKQSQKMSITAEEYQKLSYAAELSGTNMTTMQKAQKALLSSGSKLGIVDALKRCADSTNKAAAATEMFGAKTAQELLPMLNQGSEGIEKMMNNAEKCGMIMSNEAVSASAKFNDSLSTLKSTFSAVKNGIVSNLLPGLTQAMDGFTKLLSGQENAKEEILTGVKSIVSSFSKIVPQISSVVGVLVTSISEIAPQMLSALIDGVLNNLDSMLNAAALMINTLISAICGNDNLKKIIDGAMSIISALVNTLIQDDTIQAITEAALHMIDAFAGLFKNPEQLQKIIDSAVGVIKEITNGLFQAFPQIIEAASQIISALATSLSSNLPTLIPMAISAIVTIAEALIGNIDQIIDSAILIVESLAEGLINAVPVLIEKIPIIIEKLILAITNNLPKILEMGIKLIVQLAVGLIKAIPKLVVQIPQIIIAIVKGLGNGVKEMAKVGLNLVKGLWNGIKDATGWILDKIKGFGKSVLNGIKSFFGIHSPSTVFKDEVGKNLALGVGVGFESEMKSVTAKMQKALPRKLDTSIGVNALPYTSYGEASSVPFSHPASGRVFNFVINTSVNGALDAKTNLDDIAEQISYKIYDITKRKMEAFA